MALMAWYLFCFPLRVCATRHTFLLARPMAEAKLEAVSSSVARHDPRPEPLTHRCRDTVGSTSLTHSRALPAVPPRACRHCNGASKRDWGARGQRGQRTTFQRLASSCNARPPRPKVPSAFPVNWTTDTPSPRIAFCILPARCGAVFSRCRLLVIDRSVYSRPVVRAVFAPHVRQFDTAACLSACSVDTCKPARAFALLASSLCISSLADRIPHEHICVSSNLIPTALHQSPYAGNPDCTSPNHTTSDQLFLSSSSPNKPRHQSYHTHCTHPCSHPTTPPFPEHKKKDLS